MAGKHERKLFAGLSFLAVALVLSMGCAGNNRQTQNQNDPFFGYRPTPNQGTSSVTTTPGTPTAGGIPPIPPPHNPSGTVELTRNDLRGSDSGADLRIPTSPVNDLGWRSPDARSPLAPGISTSGGATLQPPQGVNRSGTVDPYGRQNIPTYSVTPGPIPPQPVGSGTAIVGNTARNFEEGIRRLQQMGMYGYKLNWNPQVGVEFEANFIDRKNPDRLLVQKGIGPNELSALQEILDKVEGGRGF